MRRNAKKLALGRAVLSAGILTVAAAASSGTPASAQGRIPMYANIYAGQALYSMRNFRPGVPGLGTLFYQGTRGYSVAGWELGRLQSIQRYHVDPGPWPGWRGALFGR